MSGYIGNIPTPQATQSRQSFTATSGQTSFATVGYTPGFVDVYVNGVHMLDGSDYNATNGSDVVLTTGATAGDIVEVISYATFEVNSQTFTGTTTADNLTVTGAFTSQGIDDNATSTAMTLDASGNLLVGKTSDSFSTQGQVFAAGGYTDLTRAGTVLNLNRLTSDGDIAIFYKDGTTVGSIKARSDRLAITDSAYGGIAFANGGNSLLPTTNDGTPTNNHMDFGNAAYLWKDLYLSGGVYLGGTGAANYLDDYEEGTWTPNFVVNGFTQTISSTSGTYTKVGRHVTVTWKVTLSSSGYMSGYSLNTNLPFVVFSSQSAATGFYGTGDISSNTIGSSGYAEGSTANLYLYPSISTTTSSTWEGTHTYFTS